MVSKLEKIQTYVPSAKEIKLGTPDSGRTARTGSGKYSQRLIDKYRAKAENITSQFNPPVQRYFMQLFDRALYEGYLLNFYSGYRPFNEQMKLYEKYKQGGNKAAPPGWSWHNFRRAIDMQIILPDGTGTYKGLDKIAELAKPIGIRWGGSFGDTPHFKYTKGTSLADQRKIYTGWQQYQDQVARLDTTGKDKEEAETEDKPKKKTWPIVVAGVVFVGVVILVIVLIRRRRK